MEFRVIIPVRYNSTRLPAKALVDIAGKPMIQHVYERAVESGAESVVIATDDKRISDVAEKFGAKVCMTATSHASGTERLAEAVEALEYDEDEIIVNVQGDEPLMPSDIIRQLARDLDEHDNVRVATVCHPIQEEEELFNPDIVKVVMNRRNYAMCFSRAAIPWERENFKDRGHVKISGNHFRHVGIYAYRVRFLRDYFDWEASPLETMEELEQLRILWHGGRIHVAVSLKKIEPGVDTQKDLERTRAFFKKKLK